MEINVYGVGVAFYKIQPMREYAQALMQGRVELFFAVREVIREECYM